MNDDLGVKEQNRFDRLRAEWQANVDLHKYHDDLKQKRFTHLLAVQTAIIAVFGLLVSNGVSNNKPVLCFVALGICIFAYALLRVFHNMDRRARGFVDVVKGKILLLEEKSRLFSTPISTYSEQFSLLSRKGDPILQEYLRVRSIQNDRLQQLLNASPAHLGEETIIVYFQRFWIIASLAAFIGTLGGINKFLTIQFEIFQSDVPRFYIVLIILSCVSGFFSGIFGMITWNFFSKIHNN
jgi:hypothetical protein